MDRAEGVANLGLGFRFMLGPARSGGDTLHKVN